VEPNVREARNVKEDGKTRLIDNIWEIVIRCEDDQLEVLENNPVFENS
jgi:hypothetical protein